MAYVIIRHKVADFGKWKPVYDIHQPARQAAGLKDVHLWRNEDDPNEVIAVFESSDLSKARDFAGSSDLKEKMKDAGVQGAPDILFLTEV
jgi:hypothetical protein